MGVCYYVFQTEKLEKRLIDEIATATIQEDKLKKEIAALKAEVSKLEKSRANEVTLAQQKIVSCYFVKFPHLFSGCGLDRYYWGCLICISFVYFCT